MEQIAGYDNWKTSPCNEKESDKYCSICGDTIYEGDYIYDIDGDFFCEQCLNDNYRKVV